MTQDEQDLSHSVTKLIQKVKDHDPEAAGGIWKRYFERLLPRARAKLQTGPARVVDEEDVLVSVFDRFFRAAGEGRFDRLNDRDDLWQILLMLTDRKVIDSQRHASAEKRGSGHVIGESQMPVDLTELQELVDHEPTPEVVAIFNENLSWAIHRLSDDKTREVAILKLEGYNNREIAEKLSISNSSVERKLRVIRTVWQETKG